MSFTRGTIDLGTFNAVKGKWGDYSSWAVWAPDPAAGASKYGMSDMAALDPSVDPALLDKLTPNIILLGLNAADRAVSPVAWGNFHDPSSTAQDYKMRRDFTGTPIWGAYMTDLFVGLHKTDSSWVKRHIKDNPEYVKEQVARLEQELKDIGAENPVIIAFGVTAYDAASQLLGGKYIIEKMPHYSGSISTGTLRGIAGELTEKYGLY